MELKLKGVRLAFFNGYRPGKATTDRATGKVTPGKYGVQAIFEVSSADPAIKLAAQQELQKAAQVIQQVAREKWGDKADAILASLKAKGDICVRDGATKGEYDGFAGNYFIASSNATEPAIVAPVLHNGKVVYVAEDGRGFIDGKVVEGMKFKAPYGGCYGNISLDIWAQDNEYGKKINAKLLGVQFAKDGAAFAGGAQFDEATFDYAAEDAAAASAGDPWATGQQGAQGGFSFGGEAAAPAPAAGGGFSFGGGTPGGFSF
jgi:hypothetical protein